MSDEPQTPQNSASVVIASTTSDPSQGGSTAPPSKGKPDGRSLRSGNPNPRKQRRGPRAKTLHAAAMADLATVYERKGGVDGLEEWANKNDRNENKFYEMWLNGIAQGRSIEQKEKESRTPQKIQFINHQPDGTKQLVGELHTENAIEVETEEEE